MSETKETKVESGSHRLQRDAEKIKVRKAVKAIREGHTTGGYCDTEALHAEEKRLHKILSEELGEAKKKHGYSPDPRFKHPDIRIIELELNGLSWKPLLVEAAS